MKFFIRLFLFSLLLIPTVAYNQTASLLPNAVQQFFDNNGNPLSVGTVDTYVAGTSTRKTTWKNSGETVTNTNPIILDAGGKAIIYGEGTYRQVVKDRNGNIIWDAVTTPASGGGGGGGTATTLPVGWVNAYSGIIAPTLYQFAYGQELIRSNFPDLFTAITITQNVGCTNTSTTITGLTDTTQIPIGGIVELSCVAPGTTVVSKTSSTVVLSNSSNVSLSASAVFFLYGNGNGSTTFNLPDLRGQVIAGRNNMGSTASSNLTTAYFGTSPDATGARGGTQSKVLIGSNLPAYTPTGIIGSITPAGTVASTDSGHTHGFASNLVIQTGAVTVTPSASGVFGFSNTGLNVTQSGTANITSTFTGTSVTPVFTGSAQGGTSTAFSIVQPTTTLNYIIKVLPGPDAIITSGVDSIQGMTGVLLCGIGMICSTQTLNVDTGTFGHKIPFLDLPNRFSANQEIALANPILFLNDLSGGGSAVVEFSSSSTVKYRLGSQFLSANNGFVLFDDANSRYALQLNIVPGLLSLQPSGGVVTVGTNTGVATDYNFGSVGTSTFMSFVAGPHPTGSSPGVYTSGITANFFSGNPVGGTLDNVNPTVFIGRVESNNTGGAGPSEGGAALNVVVTGEQNVGGFNANQTNGITILATKASTAQGNVAGFNSTATILGTNGGAFGGFAQANVFNLGEASINGIGFETGVNDGTGISKAYDPICCSSISNVGIDIGYSGSFNGSAVANGGVALQIRAASGKWGVGLGFMAPQGSDGGIQIADIQSDTNSSVFMLLNSGTHDFGIYGRNATFVSAILDFKGFIAASNGNLSIGEAGYSTGTLGLVGTTAGAVTQTVAASTGNVTVTWGNSSGTPVVTASSPLTINSTTGNITCTTCATSALTNTHIFVGNASNVATDVAMSGDATIANTGTVTIAANAITLAKLATQATNTVLGNATSGSAVPTALSVISCSTTGSALIWTTNTGFGCNTAIVASSSTTATTATNATNTAITDDTTTNATMNITWVTSNTGNLPQKTTSTKLTFNPSTGALSATSFIGSLATTNLTGTLQAAQEPAHTGDVTNSAGSLALSIAANAVTLAKLATQATNTVLGNATSGSAVPTALAVGTCSTSSSALIWTTNTGFGCNTSIAASTVTTNANLTGAVTSSGNATSLGSFTSANLSGALTDETGSGAAVFAASPAFSGTITFPGSTTINSSGFLGVGTATISAIFANYTPVNINGSSGASINFMVGATSKATIIGDSNSLYLASSASSVILSLGTGTGVPTLTATTLGISINVLSSDTATTDATLCARTSDNFVLKGTGALGICLGTSGRQFKTAFAPMRAGIEELMQIDLLNYRYLPGYGDGGARVQYGPVAQNVEAALPDLAGHDKNGETINYDSGALLFVGLHAIQQLKADNDNLRQEIENLKHIIGVK